MFLIVASYMYPELHQIGADFRAYHKFKRSPDTLNKSAFWYFRGEPPIEAQ
jgi:hypothetical protein